MRSVTEQNDVLVIPLFITHRIKGDPLRVIREQSRTVELFRENFRYPIHRDVVADSGWENLALCGVESCPPPNILMHFNKEGALRCGIRVRVNVHDSPRRVLDVEGKGLERAVDTEPHEAGFPRIE